jgi:Sigma 54 modulation protein / S30EA ribosomal protein
MMAYPIEITFRNMPTSQALSGILRRHAEALGRYHPRIVACRVALELLGRHRHKGRIINVRIDVSVPGSEIVVERSPAGRLTHTDVRLAIRDAFAAARRQIQDAVRRRRPRVTKGGKNAL